MDVEANLNIEMMVESDWSDFDLLCSHWLVMSAPVIAGQYLARNMNMNNHFYSAALPSPQDTRLD